jgi:hypothetical protein
MSTAWDLPAEEPQDEHVWQARDVAHLAKSGIRVLFTSPTTLVTETGVELHISHLSQPPVLATVIPGEEL